MKKEYIFICFSTSEGSLSDHFVNLANELSEYYHVLIFSDNKYRPYNLRANISVNFWPSKRPTRLKDFLFYLRFLKKKKPILTISLFGAVNVNIITSFLMGIKYRIAWKRSLSTQFKQKKILVLRKRLVYKLANIIICNSNSTAIDAQKFHSIQKNKIKVLPNSVVDYYHQFKDIKIEEHKILYVGRLHESKGVDTLIRAFEIVADEHDQLQLNIIGSGSERQRLRQLADQTGFSERIHFKGKQPKETVLKEMKSSMISIVPSYSEAFGYTVIEAMSMKTAVIGADNTGIKEIIIDKKTGLLFKTGDYKDLSKKIKYLYQNPEKRESLAKNGYVHFKEKYSSEKAVKRDAEFLKKLIQEK